MKEEKDRKMQITTKPSSHGVGDVKTIAPITKQVLDILDGRPKAYLLATVVWGELRIYTEAKFYEEW